MVFRLLIADDSPLYRLRLTQVFAASDRLQVVGLACDGREAVRLIGERRPNVLLLDLEMPELDGFSVLRWAMKHEPLPVVVCSGRTEAQSVFRALEAGAVDFITKPDLRHAIRSEEFAAHLRIKVEAAAEAHAHIIARDEDAQAVIHAARVARSTEREKRARIVAIVGSAGSPAVVSHIFGKLRADFSTPVVVALHMPQGFTRSFAERLARSTRFTAREARDGEEVAASHIYMAPGGQHTSVLKDETGALHFKIEEASERDFYAPSADRLLGSLAEACGAETLGVVLTGMGDDGLRGARKLHQRGGRLIVESRESAVIWGMPRAVSEAGLAEAELSPAAIAAALPLLCRQASGSLTTED